MHLSDEFQRELRNTKVISEQEVVKKEGDLFIAVNVINQQRRIINIEKQLLERFNLQSSQKMQSERRILRG